MLQAAVGQKFENNFCQSVQKRCAEKQREKNNCSCKALCVTIMVIIFWNFLLFYQISFHHKWGDGQLLVINMVFAACLAGCRAALGNWGMSAGSQGFIGLWPGAGNRPRGGWGRPWPPRGVAHCGKNLISAFQEFFLPVLTRFSFWRGDWALGCGV